ncbi:MAG: hypothetical protein FWB72_03315 [Firmicutes bacterium]|nr:hypothetical protein [Bacillota bacterium]
MLEIIYNTSGQGVSKPSGECGSESHINSHNGADTKSRKGSRRRLYLSILTNSIIAVVITAIFAVTLVGRIVETGAPVLSGVTYRGNAAYANISLMFTLKGQTYEHLDSTLEILTYLNTPATFFMSSNFASSNADTVRGLSTKGSEVAITRPVHITDGFDEIAQDLTLAGWLISALTRDDVRLYSPAFTTTQNAISASGALGLSFILPTRQLPTLETNQDRLMYYATTNIQNGYIILVPLSAHTVLRRIIVDLQAQGFEFVTISENIK